VAQKPRPAPRVVRLGRPANDNARRTGPWARTFVVALATAIVLFALYDWRVI
jgi:hypothetical protein